MDDLHCLFRKMEKEGRTDVDNLIKWMKESKLIEATKEGEEKAKALFKDVQDQQNVQLDKFQEALEKLAKEQHKNLETVSKEMVEQTDSLFSALKAGFNAFKEAYFKK